MCKDRTTKWGFGKTVKKKEYEDIIQKQSMQQQHGAIWIRGRQVKQRDVNRYMKRRKLDGGEGGQCLNQAPSEGQAIQHTTSPDRENALNGYGPQMHHDARGGSSESTLAGDATTELAEEQLTALKEHPDILRGTALMGSNQRQSPSSHDFFSPGGFLSSSILTPTWPDSPICRLLLREESEHCFADSVQEMRTILSNFDAEKNLGLDSERLSRSPLVSDASAIEEHGTTSSPTSSTADVSEIASRWISFCSLAAMQHPSGKFGVLRHALDEASILFDEMVRTSDRQLLSSIIVFGAILEAHGKDDSVGTLLSHTCDISSTILGSGHFLTITIAWIVDALSKKKDRARVSLSKLREISYAFERDYGKLHPYHLTSLFNLAKALDLDQYTEEAEPLLRGIVKMCPKVFSLGHPQTIIAQMNLARVALRLGHSSDAATTMASAVSSSHERWGPEHPYTLECLRRQAILLETLEEPEQIEEILERVLRGRIKSLGYNHRFVYGSTLDLECWLEDRGREEEAHTLRQRIQEWAKEAGDNDARNAFAAY
jgi:hypothetical protein